VAPQQCYTYGFVLRTNHTDKAWRHIIGEEKVWQFHKNLPSKSRIHTSSRTKIL
jgi:hypothetical protein